MRYLSIDYGVKRSGAAICDPSETIVSPLCVIRDKKNLFEKIVSLVKTEDAGAVVLGLPLNMDDSEGPQAKLVRDFAERLKKHINVPIYFQDERLSSFSAEKKLVCVGLSKTKKRGYIDAVAAAEILESFLERKRQDGQAALA
jgi:putative Holliday junction resolvase